MRGRIRSQKSHLTLILKSLMFGDRQYLYLIQKISTQSCIRCFSFVIQKKKHPMIFIERLYQISLNFLKVRHYSF
jgi:hypothetical protein